MSEPGTAPAVRALSRLRRAWLLGAAMAGLALGLALVTAALRHAQGAEFPPAMAAALACLAGAALSLKMAVVRRREPAFPAPSVAQIARGELPTVTFIDPARIVVLRANQRTVLWRDQADAVAFRRLAVAGRWCPGGANQGMGPESPRCFLFGRENYSRNRLSQWRDT